MRTIIFGLAAALTMGGMACKKSDSEKAASELKKAQENLDEQRKDVASEQKDIAKEQKDVAEAQKDVTKERVDVAKQEGEQSAAEQRLVKAKADFDRVAREKLATIDSRLATLESKTDEKMKQKAGDLRARRAAVASRLETMNDKVTSASWDDFTKTTGEDLDKLVKDLDEALK